MDSGNNSGHHHHGHHPHPPPPEHHGHHYPYDPQTGQPYPNYGNYPNYPGYGYYHHEGGAPPPPPHHHHQYHEGQPYYPPPPYYHEQHHYGMEHGQHGGVKAESEGYYNAPPQHHVHEGYRMEEGHNTRQEVQEEAVMPPDVKVPEPEPIEVQVVTTTDALETHNDQIKDMKVEPVVETVENLDHEVAEAPAEPKEEDISQQQDDQAKVEAEEVSQDTSEPLDLSEGKVFPFDDILKQLQNFHSQHGHANIPVSHPAFAKIITVLVDNDIEKETDKEWDRQFTVIKEYKEKYGRDCEIPYTDPKMGEWMALHRKMHADGVSDPLTVSRFAKLDAIGFEWDLSVWDKRLQELAEYTQEHKHTDVPIKHPGGLGVWVINQKFNIHDMPKERIVALDALGFIWNHNRKRRTNKAWDNRYEELVEYVKKHKTANVPTTAGHSKLSKWVGKQREEYKKFINKQSSQLDRTRIDRLNEIGFQWSLQQWTVVPWEERFEELKKYKEEHGHLKIPRSHPYFGNWPNWQRTQYKLYLNGKDCKITKDKVDKLISIGFFKPSEKNAADLK